jgi:hypothetical protein
LLLTVIFTLTPESEFFIPPSSPSLTANFLIGPHLTVLRMGVDEQLGGYRFHHQAFERGRWEKLHKELQGVYPS